MENSNKNTLTTTQAISIIVGSMIGIGILSLPANLASIAGNDGWMGVIIGSIYPFYMVACAIFIFKDASYQDRNIIEISKNYFGKVIGSILAFIFSFQFFTYIIITTANISSMLRVYLVLFLEQYRLAIPILLISVYTATKGIKTLGRINEIVLYLSIPLIAITALAIKQGSILNIKPIFDAPLFSIIKSSIEPIYSFVGIEIVFLITPLMKHKENIKSSFLKSVSIIVFLYVWLSFIAIYYLGADVAQNLYWPTLSLAETIAIPGISNFKFVFMFLWSSIVFKTIANQNYFFYYSLSTIFKKINPYILYISVFLVAGSIISRINSLMLLRMINKTISIFYFIFNLVFITIITIMKIIKYGGKNEKVNGEIEQQ